MPRPGRFRQLAAAPLPWLLLASTMLASVAAAAANTTDPKDDVANPLRYITNNTLSAVGLALMTGVAIAHTCLMLKTGSKYMLAMIIGEYCYSAGIGLRILLHYNPDSIGIYIAMYLPITLSPCGFIAAEYVILGRLARYLDAGDYLLIRPTRVTKLFVTSDIMTFLIQGFGGSLSATSNKHPANAALGSHITLAGLLLQLASFVCFCLLFVTFIFRVHKHEPQIWHRDSRRPFYRDWRALAFAMAVSCIGVLVRSVYRSVEFSEGYHGYLTTTEIFFWVLDFIPLWVALIIYVPFWPGRFIHLDDIIEKQRPLGVDATHVTLGRPSRSQESYAGYVSPDMPLKEYGSPKHLERA